MRLCVITDEISQDLGRVLDVCGELGIKTVELRAVSGSSILSHDDVGLEEIKGALDARGFGVGAIASPFLKCHLGEEDAPQGDTHFADPASRDEQWQVLERSFEVARLFGAPLVRAFSFWRVEDPETVREEVAGTLAGAARRAGEAGFRIGVENEHTCNLGTGEETGWAMKKVSSPALGAIWDPGNEAMMDSNPFPDGYSHVKDHVFHVHLKDVDAEGNWTSVGSGVIDYEGQLKALADDGYDGILSIETHYSKDGSKEAATRECVAGLRGLCERAGIELE